MTDKELEQMLEAADKAGMFSNVDDCRDVLWIDDDSYIQYNTDNNEEDLANGDGNTYSFDVYIREETESFIIFRAAYLCTGDRVTFVFSKARKFDVDAYWQRVESEEELGEE